MISLWSSGDLYKCFAITALTGFPVGLLSALPLVAISLEMLLGGLLLFSVWPSQYFSCEMLEPLHCSPCIHLYHSVSTSIIWHLNAEVLWQVGWIPISCHYQKWTREVKGSGWHTISNFTFIEFISIKQNLECYPLSILQIEPFPLIVSVLLMFL